VMGEFYCEFCLPLPVMGEFYCELCLPLPVICDFPVNFV
jgi:hypothetical protein